MIKIKIEAMIEKAFENLDPKAEKRIKELTDEVERLALFNVSGSFFKDLVDIPSEIDGYELRISKEDDGRWIVVYETDFGYLKAKNDRHNKCIHDNIELEKAIEETLKWLQNYR